MTGKPGARRTRLGAALRDARRVAGMTQAQAAAALGCRQGKINKIETTHCAISPKDLSHLLRIYQVPDEATSGIRALAVSVGPGQPADTRPNPSFLQLLELERRATEILALHSERIPRPLQSEPYMLMQFTRSGDPTDLTSLLYDWQERANVITGEHPPHYNVILSESSLHRMPGGRTPALVIDQAEHLVNLGIANKRVAIQILTFDADIPYLDADFTVLRFAGQEKDVAYVEHASDGRMFRAAKPVADRILYWQRLRHAALSVEDSRKFLENLIDEARTAWRKTAE
ncbi:helix-turn-helix domain-containing protein [Actinophytocola sediminis]